jgi:hypothetical protein
MVREVDMTVQMSVLARSFMLARSAASPATHAPVVSAGGPKVYSSLYDFPVNPNRSTGFPPIRGTHENPVT